MSILFWLSVSFGVFLCGWVLCFHLSGHIILCCKHKAVSSAYCQSPDTLRGKKPPRSICQKIIPQTITIIILQHVALQTCHIHIFLLWLFLLKQGSTRFTAIVSHCKVCLPNVNKCGMLRKMTMGNRKEVTTGARLNKQQHKHYGCGCNVHHLQSHNCLHISRACAHIQIYTKARTHKST